MLPFNKFQMWECELDLRTHLSISPFSPVFAKLSPLFYHLPVFSAYFCYFMRYDCCSRCACFLKYLLIGIFQYSWEMKSIVKKETMNYQTRHEPNQISVPRVALGYPCFSRCYRLFLYRYEWETYRPCMIFCAVWMREKKEQCALLFSPISGIPISLTIRLWETLPRKFNSEQKAQNAIGTKIRRKLALPI